MSNFDLVFVYAPDHAEEFRERGLPHPEVRPDNEMPTTNDLLWAVGTFKNLSYDRLPRSEDGELTIHDEKTDCWFSVEGFDWEKRNYIPGDYFTLRGRGYAAFALLIRLCERCGQLVLYPDTGEAPIVFDATLDAETVDELHTEAQNDDDWGPFFEQMYGET